MSRVRNPKPIGIDTPGLGGIETPIGLGGIETLSGSTPGLGGIEPLVMRGFDPTESWGSIPDFHSKLTSKLLVRSLVSLLVSY